MYRRQPKVDAGFACLRGLSSCNYWGYLQAPLAGWYGVQLNGVSQSCPTARWLALFRNNIALDSRYKVSFFFANSCWTVFYIDITKVRAQINV